MRYKIISEIHSDEEKTDNTGDGNVEVDDNKVALISESNAHTSYVAVMVSLEYTPATDDAVMTSRRLNMLT